MCPECPEGMRQEKPYNEKDGCGKFSCKCIPDDSIQLKPKRPCPLISCPRGKFGKCQMIDGCKFCRCLPVCPPLPKQCPPGCTKMMKSGCPYCYCPIKPPVCRPVMCFMFCPYGFETDVNGCNMCRCRTPSPCPLIECKINCTFGYEKDERGCRLCKCKPCRPVRCKMYCRFGYKKDKRGCETCRCNRGTIEMKPYKVGAPGSKRG